VTHAVIATLWRFRSSSKAASSAFGSRIPLSSSKLLRGHGDVGMEQGIYGKAITQIQPHSHTHTHTHIYTHIYTQTHTHTHIHIYTHKHTYTHINIYRHTHTECVPGETRS
jgi:hypothetical protein